METLTYGPQTSEVKAFLMKVESITLTQVKALKGNLRTTARGRAWDALWASGRGVVWEIAWDACLGSATWETMKDPAWDAASDALLALLVKDLISAEDFDILYRAWASVMEVEP